MEWIQYNLLWLIASAIVVIGLLIGIKDVVRLSWYRIWAIGGVCFQESIRRRVLWIIPLAILGVLGATAFQKATDQQDAIRQTIQFSLFATGMLLVLTLIILACTNLPREIENRVIFTIVTKPTSRLEIVIGKVVGFSRVSALVLAIMGLFTLSYLGVQSWRMHSAIDERLKVADIGPGERASLSYYQQFGLLSARKLVTARAVNVLAVAPAADGVRWSGDYQDGGGAVPFYLTPEAIAKLAPITDAAPNDPAAPVLIARLHFNERPSTTKAQPAPTTAQTVSPLVNPPTASGTAVIVQINTLGGDPLVDSSQLGGTTPIPANHAPLDVAIPPKAVEDLVNKVRGFEIRANCISTGKQFTFTDGAAELLVMSADHKQVLAQISPPKDPVDPSRSFVRYYGRSGRGGQQVRGGADNTGTVALLQYRNAGFGPNPGDVSLEVRTAVERDSGDSDDLNDQTKLELTFINRSAPDAPPVVVHCYPENSRALHLTVPGQAVANGDFDVLVRSTTNGNWFTVDVGNFALVSGTQPFFWNLAKSLFVMWLMSLLVITASVFTSTFVSWPIAVMLTLLILLGRWGVNQLGDSLQPGIGNAMATTMGLKDSGAATTVSKSVEALSAVLRNVGAFLPDITQFSAAEDIQRGLQVQPDVLYHSGVMLLVFGLPMLVLAYVCLRYKEVAP